MSDETHENAESQNEAQQGENLNPAEPRKTPLEQVHEQQAMEQESREALNDNPNRNDDILGHSRPSDARRHPSRQTNYSAD